MPAGVYKSLRSLRLSEKKVSRKGTENAKAPRGDARLCALSGLARKNIPRVMRLSQRRRGRKGMYDPCMNMYAKQTSRVIPRAALVPVQGRALCPSTNNVRPIYQSGGDVFKSAVVFFSGWDIFRGRA